METRNNNRESSLSLAQFTEKYINFFEREFGSIESKYQFFDRTEFANDCEAFGFEMDCGNSFIEAYGSDAFNDEKVRELNNVIDRIDNVQLIGNALFSQWRYFNHWAYSISEANEDTKEWFLLLLRRLKSLCEEQKMG